MRAMTALACGVALTGCSQTTPSPKVSVRVNTPATSSVSPPTKPELAKAETVPTKRSGPPPLPIIKDDPPPPVDSATEKAAGKALKDLGCAVAFYGESHVHRVQIYQPDAKLSAILTELSRCKRLANLEISQISFDDTALKEIARFTELKELWITANGSLSGVGLGDLSPLKKLGILSLMNCAKLNDAGMKGIATLPRLETLFINNCPITDAGVRNLSGSIRIKTVKLQKTKMTDVGVKDLAGLTRLENLTLGESEITDVGIQNIPESLNLKTVNVPSTNVSDAGVMSLTRFLSLNSIDLSRTKITDKSLPELAKLPSLNTLMIANTAVTDAGLATLAPATKLNFVAAGETKVTKAGAAALKKSLPNVTVDLGN